MCEDYRPIPEHEPIASVNTTRMLHKALSSTAAERLQILALWTNYSTIANISTNCFNIKKTLHVVKVPICVFNNNNNNNIYLFTVIRLLTSGSSYFTCIQNMKLVATECSREGYMRSM